MGVPLRYSLRNLTRRKVRTGLTIAAMALVVSVSVVMFAFAKGLFLSAKSSGSTDNVIVIDRKAANQAFSKLSLTDFNLLKSLPQVKRNERGEPLISPECIQQARVTAGDFKDRPATLRGVKPMVFEVNQQLRLTEGEKAASPRKLMVGSLAHASLGVPAELLAVGKELEFGGETWTIVGRFDAGGTAMDSELVADLNDVMALYNRDTYSAALIKLQNPGEVPLLVRSLNNRNDIQVQAVAEREYYASLAEGFDRIIFLAVFLAVIAGIGGLVSGMNTMYASVLGRIREIGTLKTLGYGPGAIVRSFVIESVAIAVVGGAIGAVVALQANGISAKFAKGAVNLTIDHWAMIAGGIVALVIGVCGALPPALKGARMEIPAALHYS
ncbi:MAG: FtsX-like permease family protein [Planctomycetes bacterium]|nr:FtsX-like permease family protein [Planctomycetota bacterium]